MEELLLIDSPTFCAGITVKDNVVVKSAPLISYMIGWNVSKVQNYCLKKKWELKNHIPFHRAHEIDKNNKIKENWDDLYPFMED